jgi:hypothetical protein
MTVDCSKIPTLDDIYNSKSSMDDINSFSNDTSYTFVDSKGATRPTLAGLINSFGGIIRNKFIATSNQLTYTMPSTTTVVSFVYVQGIYQFSGETYEFDNITKVITFANPGLTLGHSVEIFSGIVPNIEGDASDFTVTSTDSSSSKPLRSWTQDIVDLDETAAGLTQDIVDLDETLERYGLVGDGITPNAAAFEIAIRSGKKLKGKLGAVYLIESGVNASNIAIELDLNGSTLVNTSATDRMLIAEYPYLNINAITAVDLAGQNVTLTSITGYEVGARVKIVSGDRCPGNRPAEVGGENYWQSQTLTVDSIAGLVVSFREPFEEDFTFATSPKIMIYSAKSCNIYNGSAYSEKGFAATRNNGLFRVKGGTGSSVNVKIENSNATAIEYWGVDAPVNNLGNISNVGQSTDILGSHGISHISCITPKVLNTVFRRTRHGQTNNDTPTLYADNNYYVMGPTYDLLVTGCHNSGDIAGAFSTHHGVRRAQILSNSVSGALIGGGFRGRDVTVRGLKTIGVTKAAFFYSETNVATVDKTTRWFLDGVESKNTSEVDLQVQKCLAGTLGTNTFKGGAPRGWFLNEGGTVILQGNNEFFSNGTLNLDDNFLHAVNTSVENFGTLSIDIDSMTVNGTNNVIRSTSDKFFKSYGKILCEEPVGMDNIFRHIGAGETLLSDVTYINNIGFPFIISSTIAKASGRTFDGSYTTKYSIKTASVDYDLSLNDVGDEELTVTLLTASGVHTLASVTDGKFTGQKLTLRVLDSTGTNGFTLDASITNLNLNGADLTIADGETRRFFWSGGEWVIESRNG